MSRSTERVDSSVGSDAETDHDDHDDEPLVSTRGLVKHFEQAEGWLDRLVGMKGKVRAVDGVDLDVYPGETLAIVGESGCGKSTLARTMLNLDEPTDGSVYYRGEDIAGLTGKEMRPYRRELQMVFQDPVASLNPRKRVGQILKKPMAVHGIGDDGEDRTERAREVLERVGLEPGHIHRYPNQFSGGQQQRIGVARALVVEPDLLIADEPVSELDVSVQAQILNLLEGLQDEMGVAIVFIAHNLSVVRHIADRVAVMYLGKIVETADVEELFADPQHPYTKSLLSAVPRINPDARTDRVILEGTVPSPTNPPAGCRFHTRCPVVIPPDDWEGSQEAFKAAFTFRNRVESSEIEVEAIRDRLRSEEVEVTTESVAEHLLEHSLPDESVSLPSSATDVLRRAARALAEGDEKRARELLADGFPSPCEETARMVEFDDGHRAACHRIDDESPGKSMDWWIGSSEG
jgi:peptide/nickel transport system ATP-binding protein